MEIWRDVKAPRHCYFVELSHFDADIFRETINEIGAELDKVFR